MKTAKLYLLIVSIFVSIKGNSQIVSDYCQYAPRFDQEVFSGVTTTSNIVYGWNVNYTGTTDTLLLDVYEPTGDTMSMRPLIFFVHGGSFLTGTKSDQDVVSLCNHFAKRGYVTVSINYRLGMNFPPNQTLATQAVYRAVQDMKAAVRFFRQDAATANIFRIDPSVIIAGGSSAGAFTALHLAYLNNINELPSAIDTTVLGNIEGTTGNPGYPSNVQAVVNLCGALGDSAWMIPGDIPIVSVHGTNDGVVPYNTAMLTIAIYFQIMVVDGSWSIHHHAREIGVTNSMYTFAGAPHVPYAGSSATQLAYMDTTVRFVSNFIYQFLGCQPIDTNPQQNTFTDVNVGVNTVDEKQQFRIYPNPAIEHLNVEALSEVLDQIILSDLRGRILFRKDVSINDYQFDTSALSSGFYFLTLKTTKGSTYTFKVEKQ